MTTLKTTKKRTDKLLRRLEMVENAMPNVGPSVLVVDEQDIRDLCHDADRAEELEKEVANLKGWIKHYERGEPEAWKALRLEVIDLRAKLEEAINRMDRARDILTKGTPTLECNWGLLDTEDLRALKEQEKKT